MILYNLLIWLLGVDLFGPHSQKTIEMTYELVQLGDNDYSLPWEIWKFCLYGNLSKNSCIDFNGDNWYIFLEKSIGDVTLNSWSVVGL